MEYNNLKELYFKFYSNCCTLIIIYSSDVFLLYKEVSYAHQYSKNSNNVKYYYLK